MTESNLASKADESVATGALMPLVSLRKHYKLSLALFILISLLGIPFALLKGTSFYSVTALIYVAPRVPNVLQENKEQELPSYQQYKQFEQQQAGTIARYDLLLKTFKKMGKKRFLWQHPGETERRAAERLQAALVIKPVNDTYLLSVSLESDKKEGLEEIVNAVVENYVENAQEEQLIYASKERIQLLYAERDKLQKILNTKKSSLITIGQELGVTTFVDSTVNPYDVLLTDGQSAYLQAQRERMVAQANLLLFDNPKDSKAAAALEAAVADIVYKDPGLTSLKANMYKRRSELINLISGLDARHPGYAQIKNQLEVIEAEVVEATAHLTKNVKNMLLEERRSKVSLTQKIEQDLYDQIVSQKKNSSWFSTRYNQGLTLNQDIKHFYNQLENVENRISFLELESKAPGMIRIDGLARSPEFPIRGGRKKLLLIMIVLGAVVGCVVPIVIDMLDKRIKTAGQVEKLLGYKPLAALLEFTQHDQTSQNTISHQRRRLALALERERNHRGKSSHFILLTAVVHDSAVTSLALTLAMDYKTIDERAIVVEVNLLTPDARYRRAVNSVGLVNFLSDSDLLVSEIISPADADYPDRISVGLSEENLLFGYSHLQKLLEKIAQTYAVVILDAAPILYSADTEFFANICDITLLVIAAQQAKPGEIKRAVKLLERIDPKAIGFVVTRLEIFKGGGYYASMNDVYSQKKTAALLDKNMTAQQPRLLYFLHSGNLYGTERMALVTLDGLRNEFEPLLFAPPGVVHQEAQRIGIASYEFNSAGDLFKQLPAFLRNTDSIIVCATGVSHSLLFIFWNCFFRVKNLHLHFVHGGTDEYLSYGRKKILNHFPLYLVAVSDYVKQRLLAHGVKESKIKVLENFLPDAQIANALKRAAFQSPGIQKVLVISRIDPIKRIDILLDALDIEPALKQLEIRILGTGWEFDSLKQRAAHAHPNVTFVGFTEQVAQELSETDLLLHLCPTEPFGLAILEAMAAKVPLLLPNAGGAGSLIVENISGWYFQANNAQDLARQLLYLQTVAANELNSKAEHAYQRLIAHYSSHVRLSDYRQLFQQVL